MAVKKYILEKDASLNRSFFSVSTQDDDRRIFSVSEVTRDIRLLLEEAFSGVWIDGEVSGFKRHTSGHMYFSMKDETAQIQCVMFRTENHRLDFEVKEGMAVLCFGRVSVYPVRGQYQLYVERIEPKGIGALQLKFEELKKKLKDEGFFDAARKRPIPFLPAAIGLVTSIDGAALRDILNVLDRRFSNVKILIYPVKVQGAGAADEIAQAITDFNRLGQVDVLIVGRGGGSLEDLWAFNEEVTARAIFESKIPVISAVGHEVDFTIADFVADLRAATPSAAAEIVMPEKEELFLRVSEQKIRLSQSLMGLVRHWKQELKVLTERRVLKHPLAVFEIKFQKLDDLKKSLSVFMSGYLSLKKERFLSVVGKLEALGPLATLKRGFSVSLKASTGEVVTSAASLKKGELIMTRLAAGSFVSEVKETSI